MNYKKLLIGISIVNAFSWLMLELWGKRYSGTNIAVGAGILVFIHTVGYYIICIISASPVKEEEVKITPQNCNGHDWQKLSYSEHIEVCVKCEAKRGI